MRTAREQRVALAATIQRPICLDKAEPIHLNAVPFNRREQAYLACLFGVAICGLVSFGGFVSDALPELKHNLLVSSLAGMTMVCLALAVITASAKRS
jgi:hypothetical protein